MTTASASPRPVPRMDRVSDRRGRRGQIFLGEPEADHEPKPRCALGNGREYDAVPEYAAVHEVAGSVHRRLRISEHYGKDRDHRVPRQLDAMLLELLAEKVRPVPKRGRQLRTLALQDPEARQAAGSNHRRDVRREERWTSTVSDELDQVPAARDV